MRHVWPVAALLLALASGSGGAAAQDFPTRPVTVVVPFAAGGPIDLLARLIQAPMAKALGQPVVIENVTGGGGMTGSNRVKLATPDGYQIMIGSIGTHTLSPLLAKHPLYDPVKDFAPVILADEVPLVLLVRKDLPVQNLQEFVAYVKANHARMQFSSAGTGTSSHIGSVLLDQTIGVEVTHIPYRGGGPALTDLIAGRVDYLCTYVSTAQPAVVAGQVRALAIMGRARSAGLPSVPTASEQGVPLNAYTWNAVFAPKGTPAPVIARLNAAVSTALDDPTLRERLAKLGLDIPAPEQRTPAYLGKYVAEEMTRWAPAVRASGSGTQ
jgi:tripartite-type tricarboxylate transporter receptor subunit TctC